MIYKLKEEYTYIPNGEYKPKRKHYLYEFTIGLIVFTIMLLAFNNWFISFINNLI